MERRRLALRIQSSKQELEAHERHLEELEGGAGEEVSESALAREYEELQQLRERIWRLERRTQNLDRQARTGPDPRIWKLSKRVAAHLRGRVLGR